MDVKIRATGELRPCNLDTGNPCRYDVAFRLCAKAERYK